MRRQRMYVYQTADDTMAVVVSDEEPRARETARRQLRCGSGEVLVLQAVSDVDGVLLFNVSMGLKIRSAA